MSKIIIGGASMIEICPIMLKTVERSDLLSKCSTIFDGGKIFTNFWFSQWCRFRSWMSVMMFYPVGRYRHGRNSLPTFSG